MIFNINPCTKINHIILFYFLKIYIFYSLNFRLLFLSFYSKARPCAWPQCHEAKYNISNIRLSTSLCSLVLPKWGNLFYCQNSRFHPIQLRVSIMIFFVFEFCEIVSLRNYVFNLLPFQTQIILGSSFNVQVRFTESKTTQIFLILY